MAPLATAAGERWGKPLAHRATGRRPPRPRGGQRFVRGPIPLPWLARAASLPGKALAVALVVWYLAGLRKRRCIRWEPARAAEFGLSRFACYRALRALEGAGLVRVSRGPGRAPEIFILDCPTVEVLSG